MPASRAARLVAALLSVVSLSACGVSDLQFRNDDRLSFSAPAERARVSLPVSVSWSMRGFDPVGLDGSRRADRGVYATFVDRAPMPVGKDLAWLARDDEGCTRDPRCPNAEYLGEQGVFVTTTPEVVLDRLPAAGDGVGDEQHYVNVVVLDGKGTRLGESAWYLPFSTKRSAT